MAEFTTDCYIRRIIKTDADVNLNIKYKLFRPSNSELTKLQDIPDGERGISVTWCNDKIRTLADIATYLEAHSQSSRDKTLGYCYIKKSVIATIDGLNDIIFKSTPLVAEQDARKLPDLHYCLRNESQIDRYPTEDEAELIARHARRNAPWAPAVERRT